MDPMGLDIAPSHISSHELTVAHKVLVQRMAATLVAELMEETDLTCQATIALSSYLNLTIISTWCCVYVTESLRHMNLLKIINQNIHQHPIYLLKIVIFNDFKPPFGKGCTLRAAQTVPRKVEPSKGFTQAIRTGSVSEKTATLIRLVLWMHTQCYRIMHNTHTYIYIYINILQFIYIYMRIIAYHYISCLVAVFCQDLLWLNCKMMSGIWQEAFNKMVDDSSPRGPFGWWNDVAQWCRFWYLLLALCTVRGGSIQRWANTICLAESSKVESLQPIRCLRKSFACGRSTVYRCIQFPSVSLISLTPCIERQLFAKHGDL